MTSFFSYPFFSCSKPYPVSFCNASSPNKESGISPIIESSGTVQHENKAIKIISTTHGDAQQEDSPHDIRNETARQK